MALARLGPSVTPAVHFTPLGAFHLPVRSRLEGGEGVSLRPWLAPALPLTPQTRRENVNNVWDTVTLSNLPD